MAASQFFGVEDIALHHFHMFEPGIVPATGMDGEPYTRTVKPSFSRRGTSRPPMYPVAPVTSMRSDIDNIFVDWLIIIMIIIIYFICIEFAKISGIRQGSNPARSGSGIRRGPTPP